MVVSQNICILYVEISPNRQEKMPRFGCMRQRSSCDNYQNNNINCVMMMNADLLSEIVKWAVVAVPRHQLTNNRRSTVHFAQQKKHRQCLSRARCGQRMIRAGENGLPNGRRGRILNKKVEHFSIG